MADGDNAAKPTFNGRHVLLVKEKRSTIFDRSDNYLLEDLYLQHSKSERRFLQPLLVAVQRQSEILKEVVEKQKKVIRGLRRRQVSDQVGLVPKHFNLPLSLHRKHGVERQRRCCPGFFQERVGEFLFLSRL